MRFGYGSLAGLSWETIVGAWGSATQAETG